MSDDRQTPEDLIIAMIHAGRLKEAETLCRDQLAAMSQNSVEEAAMRMKSHLSTILIRQSRLNEAYALCAEVIIWARSAPSANYDSKSRGLMGAQSAVLALAIGAEIAGISTTVGSDSNVNAESLDAIAQAAAESEELIIEHGQDDEKCRFYLLKSIIAENLGQAEQAENHLLQAADIAKTSGDPVLTTAVASVCTARGEAAMALDLLQYSEPGTKDKETEIDRHLATAVELAEFDPPQVDESLRQIQTAIEIAESTDYEVRKHFCLIVYADVAGEFQRWEHVKVALKRLIDLIHETSELRKESTAKFFADFEFCLRARLPWREATAFENRTEPAALEACQLLIEVFHAVDTEEALSTADEIEARIASNDV